MENNKHDMLLFIHQWVDEKGTPNDISELSNILVAYGNKLNTPDAKIYGCNYNWKKYKMKTVMYRWGVVSVKQSMKLFYNILRVLMNKVKVEELLYVQMGTS